MKKIIILVILLLSLSVVVLGGCSQSASKNKTNPKLQKKAKKSASVDINDMGFDPEVTTIAKGGKVTWTNNGAMGHTVTAKDGSFNSGEIHPGDTFSHVFKKSGSVDYRCSFHVFMRGTVKVK